MLLYSSDCLFLSLVCSSANGDTCELWQAAVLATQGLVPNKTNVCMINAGIEIERIVRCIKKLGEPYIYD